MPNEIESALIVAEKYQELHLPSKETRLEYSVTREGAAEQLHYLFVFYATSFLNLISTRASHVKIIHYFAKFR